MKFFLKKLFPNSSTICKSTPSCGLSPEWALRFGNIGKPSFLMIRDWISLQLVSCNQLQPVSIDGLFRVIRIKTFSMSEFWSCKINQRTLFINENRLTSNSKQSPNFHSSSKSDLPDYLLLKLNELVNNLIPAIAIFSLCMLVLRFPFGRLLPFGFL